MTGIVIVGLVGTVTFGVVTVGVVGSGDVVVVVVVVAVDGVVVVAAVVVEVGDVDVVVRGGVVVGETVVVVGAMVGPDAFVGLAPPANEAASPSLPCVAAGFLSAHPGRSRRATRSRMRQPGRTMGLGGAQAVLFVIGIMEKVVDAGPWGPGRGRLGGAGSAGKPRGELRLPGGGGLLPRGNLASPHPTRQPPGINSLWRDSQNIPGEG